MKTHYREGLRLRTHSYFRSKILLLIFKQEKLIVPFHRGNVRSIQCTWICRGILLLITKIFTFPKNFPIWKRGNEQICWGLFVKLTTFDRKLLPVLPQFSRFLNEEFLRIHTNDLILMSDLFTILYIRYKILL